MDEKDRYDTGMKHRRAVLGDAWVDRANAKVILQSMIYAGVPAANTAVHHAEEVIAELKERQ